MTAGGAWALALALASGCSLFSGLDGLASEDPSKAADATAPDAPRDALEDAPGDGALQDAAQDAGGDASTLQNLHPFPSFDNGCGGWGAYEGTLEASSTARTGSGSCLVCTDRTHVYFTADDNGAVAMPSVGAEYVAEVWVRTAPGKPVPPYFNLTFRTRNNDPFAEVEKTFVDNGTVAVTATWQKLTATLAVTKPAQTLNVVVGSDSQDGVCFLLDDVAVYRTK